jgi:hypothetical protein
MAVQPIFLQRTEHLTQFTFGDLQLIDWMVRITTGTESEHQRAECARGEGGSRMSKLPRDASTPARVNPPHWQGLSPIRSRGTQWQAGPMCQASDESTGGWCVDVLRTTGTRSTRGRVWA